MTRTVEQAAGAATGTAGTAMGTAAQRAGVAVQRAGEALERRGAESAPAVGAAVGTAVGAAFEAADTAAETAVDVAGRVGSVLSGAAGGLAETVSGLVEEPAVRGGAALDALRGVRVGPPTAVRRWPWALGAALLGAAVGATVAVVARRIQGQDAPDALEPHELQAVVDLPAEPEPRAELDLRDEKDLRNQPGLRDEPGPV